jgi:hypothetical protein
LPIVWSVSQISGKLKWNFSAKARFSTAVSKEAPRITAFFRS